VFLSCVFLLCVFFYRKEWRMYSWEEANFILKNLYFFHKCFFRRLNKNGVPTIFLFQLVRQQHLAFPKLIKNTVLFSIFLNWRSLVLFYFKLLWVISSPSKWNRFLSWNLVSAFLCRLTNNNNNLLRSTFVIQQQLIIMKKKKKEKQQTKYYSSIA
jgi:hypothetical protein